MEADTRWDRLRELFHQAADRPAAEREAFLREACGGDAVLRAEVEALLEGDRRSQSLVRDAVRSVAREMDEPWLAGARVGPWQIVRLLGRGGMGAVYLADRADGQFEQRVALKLIKRGMDSEQILARFQRERQILARLQHPNIARLLDGGITEQGQPYFAMEHVEGVPIDEYCDRLRLTVDERLSLFLDAGRAVMYAHANLVVHRDLKPDNMLVRADGSLRLLDFGIAKVVAEDAGVTTLTQAGHHVMTPAYASPEQVRGEPVGTATDIYSLGVVLYQLLAGRLPYELAGASLVEIARVVCTTEPDRPSARLTRTTVPGATPEEIGRARRSEIDRLRRQLAGDLDFICLKAIRKEPAGRYGSVEAFMEDVRRHMEGRPVLARAGTVGYRIRKGLKRHRVAVATAAVVVGTVGTTVTVAALRLAEERDRARIEAAKATEVSDFLRGLFEVADPSASRGATITARELLDQGAERVEAGLADQPEVQVTMMRVIGEVYEALGLYAQSRPLLERALARARALYGANHEEVAATASELAATLSNEGADSVAEPLYREALAIRRQVFGPEHPAVAAALSNLAYLVDGQGNRTEAEQLYRDALAQQRLFFAESDARIATTLVRLGGLLRREGRHAEAEPVLRDALVAQRAAYGAVHPRVASAARNLGALLRDMERFPQADTLYAEALAIRRRLYDGDHSDVATTLHSYALLLERMGEYDRALAAFVEALEMLERVHPRPHPNLAIGYFDLGRELKRRGRLGEAVERFTQAIRTEDAVLRPDDEQKAFSRLELAQIYVGQGRLREAEPLLRQAVAVRRAGLAPGATDTGVALIELGTCLAGLRRFAAADSALVEGHEILLAAVGPDDPRTRAARQHIVQLNEIRSRPR